MQGIVYEEQTECAAKHNEYRLYHKENNVLSSMGKQFIDEVKRELEIRE